MFGQRQELLPDTLNFCVGDSSYVEIKSTLDNNVFISWSTPQGIITNTRRLNAVKAGKYFVRVSSAQTGAIADSCYVRIFPRLKPLMRDSILCKGKSMQLDARYSGMKYLWNNGETTQKITIDAPGRYWVKIKNGSCTTVDTVIIKAVAGANVYLAPEATFCVNDDHKSIAVKVPSGTRILWNTGANTPSISINKEGTYWVRTETSNCGQQVDTIKIKLKLCECEMIVPNSFTPNEDNRNDFFFPVAQCEYSYFYITISDRWGNTVYTSNSLNGKWDGRFKGNLCPEDIYIYRIESTERGGEKKQVRTGHISLFR